MTAAALLSVQGLVKRFPGVMALQGVDFDVRAGEVHCLLGQNGAGKSTLIKVLSGAHRPDEGEIRWRGEVVSFGNPTAAMRSGVAAIYQELDLVAGLSVADNVFLGHELSTVGFTRRADARRRTRALLARLGHPEIAPDRDVGRLSVAHQQVVSMARALSLDGQLLIMDEPSAVLDPDEVRVLFGVIRELTAQGVAVVYISHRLAEIREIGDRVTVLKDGRTVATGLPAREVKTSELIGLMTGRVLDNVFPQRKPVDPAAPDVLNVRGLADKKRFRDVDLTVRAGEVVGLAGLVGSGRSEILETIYGARKAAEGTVEVDGRRLRRGSVGVAVRAGMGLCPEERKSQGLLLDQAVYRNITVSSMSSFARFGFLDERAERVRSAQLTETLDVRPAGVDRVVRGLSGGNQQKVVLARWLLRECRVLLLDEPTRGVDVGARSEIYELIRALADSGVAVVVVSSDVEEVLGLADRVLVVREGRVVHDGPADEIDESRVLDLVMEGHSA
ncbi:monosaccharide ABC transporter ATP-binding protein, CUT2 family [Lentzea waywayandensis]|uniref:Monosaccharide ABC transporter ATP-binding protein, CUT2 family n=1 Tax=Lentzea waywayandensis TaxID=84724 RepID=A0A1I6FDK5_9PSEU|nr:sugar ABC transporter ATP-binding protein [Lentzea waywayandensis]SFR27998.1 monosaccharide ABC transporter ATP-binding protein, CUT2 family [Lentzea waywayandensis]